VEKGPPQGKPTLSEVRRLPKVLLHDHLDGGLRPATLVELAEAVGYRGLPTRDPGELSAWLVGQASRGSLTGYLSCFVHTVAVMQSAEALERVAAEAVRDLADDGVVYAEVRFAPQLHTAELNLGRVIEAVLAGLVEGVGQALASGRHITARLLLCALRDGTPARSLEVVKAALDYRSAGVAGFDLAGPERGHPASAHREAFELAANQGLPVTVHAGEAAGPASVAEAVLGCRAARIGHGVRVADEAFGASSPRPGRPLEIGGEASGLGPVARLALRRRVPLEVCPSSNVHTGAASSLETHPVRLLHDLGFRVTVNTDNRLISGVSLSSELATCATAFGWSWVDLYRLSLNAAESAFCEPAERRKVVALLAASYGVPRTARWLPGSTQRPAPAPSDAL
jgi:adenosine deaminase